jgi:hypothetical protein
MDEIFDLDHDTSPTVEKIEISEEVNIIKHDFQTARRIQNAKNILSRHSLLILQATENNEPLSMTRCRYLMMLNPKWTPQVEKEILSTKSYQKSFDFTKSSVTLVTPSNNMLEPLEDSRPSSYSSSFSPNSLNSPSKLRFKDQ